MGPLMRTDLVGSPFRKFAACALPVKVLTLSAEFVELMPPLPPSPKYTCVQVGELTPRNVPLSWVPPVSFALLSFATFTLWNWSVERPTLRLVSSVGTAFSNCWQVARSAALSPGPAGIEREGSVQVLEMSANEPLVSTTPPSEPKIALFVPGISITAWLSGCMPFCAKGRFWQQAPGGVGDMVASQLMSVKVTPASVERRNARLSFRKPYWL